ncbi:antitoxin MazE7 [Streptomyces sp. NPDC040724]|uniref:antitoxin MazE7 n=1 Tax=Streptomyces sp. NPDC040724 TaxID=3155612 RepID=UPI0033E8D54C
MADTTTVEVDTDVHDRLAVLAADRGLSLRAYLAELAAAQENEAALARAARAFEQALERPGFREGFARDFGGLATHRLSETRNRPPLGRAVSREDQA